MIRICLASRKSVQCNESLIRAIIDLNLMTKGAMIYWLHVCSRIQVSIPGLSKCFSFLVEKNLRTCALKLFGGNKNHPNCDARVNS